MVKSCCSRPHHLCILKYLLSLDLILTALTFSNTVEQAHVMSYIFSLIAIAVRIKSSDCTCTTTKMRVIGSKFLKYFTFHAFCWIPCSKIFSLIYYAFEIQKKFWTKYSKKNNSGEIRGKWQMANGVKYQITPYSRIHSKLSKIVSETNARISPQIYICDLKLFLSHT